jgi:hypothetical protein
MKSMSNNLRIDDRSFFADRFGIVFDISRAPNTGRDDYENAKR